MSLGFPRQAQAGVAAGLAAACLALTPASASAAAPSVRSQEWWLSALHVTQAQQSTRGAGVTVAVLDTGVYPDQADIKGAVTTGPDYTSSGRARGGPFWGIHGTALASLIAGRGHGRGHAAGILGVAPAASILSVQVTLESDDPLLGDVNVAAALPAAIARGIRYAVNHHATVIDLPLDPITAAGAPGAGGSAAERSAVAYALAHRVTLVAPAGDQGDTTDPVNFPAAYPGVISVGAFNAVFTKATFSSRQSYVTLTAAGDGVIAASGPTGYAVMSSTAAASAVVAGIVALIRAQFPSLSPAQVTKALTESTAFRPHGGQQDGSGAGTVDAAKALAAAARMTEAVPAAGSSPTGAAVPPGAPATHASSGLRNTLLLDLGIAAALFLLLAVPILGYGTYRRRRARAARLAEVRAAAQPVARRPQGVAAGTRHAATATPEPEEYTYIPAPVSEEPTDVIAPYTNGGKATGQPPWTPWGSLGGEPGSGSPGSGPPDSGAPRGSPPGFQGSAFPGSAFPGAARRAGLTRPDDRPTMPSRAQRDRAYGPPGAHWPTAPDERAADGGPQRAGSADAGSGQAGAAPTGSADGGDALGGYIGPDSVPTSPGTIGGGVMASHRTDAPRQPKVSGGPPWEPAPEPPGDVPWGRSAMPPTGGAPMFPTGPQQAVGGAAPEPPPAAPPGPRQSSWDAIAEEAWPGGPGASKPQSPPSRRRSASNASRGDLKGGRYDDEPATASQPIYVWNPHVTTVNLPAVEPGKNHRGENDRRLWPRRGERR